MELKSNVVGTVISIEDDIKILSIDGNVHCFSKVNPNRNLKVGFHVNLGDVIGELIDENELHHEVYNYYNVKNLSNDKHPIPKFKVEQSLNHTVLNILDKYKLKITPSINIESIIVDYRRPESYGNTLIDICLLGTSMNGKYTYTSFLKLNSFNFVELAELLSTMVTLYKPKDIKLDTCGMGRGVKEALEVKLNKNDIEYGDQGLLLYNASKVKLEERELLKNKIQAMLDNAEYSLSSDVTSDINKGLIHGIVTMARLVGFKVENKENGQGITIN